MNTYYAIRKYHSHKYNAKKRNIEFELTFDQWNQWWITHGVDKSLPNMSGNTKDNLCMCRYNDAGPYSLDNIYCDTNINNSKSMHVFRSIKASALERINKYKQGDTVDGSSFI